MGKEAKVIRLPSRIWERVKAQAEREHRSVNNMIAYMVDHYLNKEAK